MAAAAWTGGDDLPTNPLACDGDAGRRRRPSPMTAARRPTRPTATGKPITVVDVPKLIGIGYFNATSKGIADAAKELGNVDRDDRRSDQGQHRRADHLHRQLHHQRRRRHPVRRQRSGRDRAGAEEGARRRASTSSAMTPTRRPTPAQWFVNQAEFNGIAKAHDRQHGEGDRRGRRLRHRHLDLHHAQPGALDRRDGGLCRQVPSRR